MRSPDHIASALALAMARRGEAHADCPLFNDPYAEVFIDAAQRRGCRLPTGDQAQAIDGIANYTSSRTKWFDDFFLAAGGHGLEQAVILAAGLDARAWRLPWVGGTALFEIDQPAVLDFKTDALREHGDTPAVDRYVPVPADLFDGWPDALCDAGYDPAEPTAWAVEGLLPYVPEGPNRLFERIHDLSAPFSRVAVETVGHAVAEWLSANGWQVTTLSAQELMTRYGRCGAHDDVDVVPDTVFVDAKRTG